MFFRCSLSAIVLLQSLWDLSEWFWFLSGKLIQKYFWWKWIKDTSILHFASLKNDLETWKKKATDNSVNIDINNQLNIAFGEF